jgi:hypothetical protein
MAKSFLYSTIELKKLPFLPKLMKTEVYQREVQTIIGKMKVFLFIDSNFQDIFTFLTRSPEISLNEYVPVLLSKQEPQLIGTIKV